MQLRTNIIRNILVLALVIGACTSCDNDFMQVEAPKTTGVLRLNMSSDEVYVHAGTRAVQTLTDWSGFQFTLDNGTTSTQLVFTDGKAIIEAGTYTLSATNAASVGNGYSGALYSGAETFSINAGEQKEVTLDLGTPKNSKVTVAFDSSFLDLYDLESLTLTDTKDKSDILSSIDDVAYFPVDVTAATQLTYNLVADAKAGSHVQDITSATGTIAISAGTHTPITLKINPIDDSLVMIVTGTEYEGVFQ